MSVSVSLTVCIAAVMLGGGLFLYYVSKAPELSESKLDCLQRQVRSMIAMTSLSLILDRNVESMPKQTKYRPIWSTLLFSD